MPNDWGTYLLVGAVVLVIAVGLYLVRRARVRPPGDRYQPPPLLDRGWQFYSRPTELEPPGTIFRIDAERRRYFVTAVPVQTQVGDEAYGKHEESVEASIGIVARFFGVKGVDAKVGGGTTERLVFELDDVAREVAGDADLDAALAPVLKGLQYRADNRYFVIRECRKAQRIAHHLTRNQVMDLGGKASVADHASLEGTLFHEKNDGGFVLEKTFDKPLRVMFLPEEIRPVSAGLAREIPELGRVPVREALFWEEAEEVPA